MKSNARCYDQLREYLETVPLVDCHDHSAECGPKFADAIEFIVGGYFCSDVLSAVGEKDMAILGNRDLSLKKRWAILKKAWAKTRFTGYGQVTQMILKEFCGVEKLTFSALKTIENSMPDLSNEEVYDGILEDANIAVRLVNIWVEAEKVLDGSLKLAPRSRITIPLPNYHDIRTYGQVQDFTAATGRTITSLDEYLVACREIFTGYKNFGAVAFKDQTAYSRSIAYDNPTRAEAEKVFNWFMEDPRRSASFPEGAKDLNDFLFHEFMRMARDLEMPVQIHTGHMAGIRNDIAKTNAIGLTKVIELHRDVQFDIFHANWPYSGELLYLCKNFPNVAIDFCWANVIDPIYCQNLFKQALSSVPHGKIHGYGSDYGGNGTCRSWAHARIARDNIAIALADLVEADYFSLDDAKEVAYGWMFGNANEFFELRM